MLNEKQQLSLSKLMSKMLRHTPWQFGLRLDAADGSCLAEELLTAIRKDARWASLRMEDIEQVVSDSDKQRYEITGGRIRARYGHSHDRVSYPAAQPPDVLYHGTNRAAAPTILEQGIRPMRRQYVHLSAGLEFASLAGSRRGELVILQVDTAKAASAGIVFYDAGSGVWLADEVPAECCRVLEAEAEEWGGAANE